MSESRLGPMLRPASPPRRSAAPGAHDVRCGGAWTRRQRLKNDFIHLLVRCALTAADRLPAGLLLALTRTLGVAGHGACTSARRHAVNQLRLGLSHQCAPHVARESFRYAGESLGLALLLRRRNISALQWVEIDEAGRRLMGDTLALGRGVVFITAHLGPFELIAPALAELGYKPAVVVRESYDPRLDRLVDAHRTSRGVQVIHRGKPNAATTMVRALKAGRPVGFLPDLGGRLRKTNVELLGCSSEWAVGPTVLATRTGASVLVGYLVPRLSGPVVGPTRTPPFSLEIVRLEGVSDSACGLQRVADILSHAISRAPERWLWMAARLQVIARTPGDRLARGAHGP